MLRGGEWVDELEGVAPDRLHQDAVAAQERGPPATESVTVTGIKDREEAVTKFVDAMTMATRIRSGRRIANCWMIAEPSDEPTSATAISEPQR